MPEYISNISKIPLVEFKGKFISQTDDNICFEININDVLFKEFFPWSKAWYNKERPHIIYVHKDLAEKKGLLGNAK